MGGGRGRDSLREQNFGTSSSLSTAEAVVRGQTLDITNHMMRGELAEKNTKGKGHKEATTNAFPKKKVEKEEKEKRKKEY